MLVVAASASMLAVVAVVVLVPVVIVIAASGIAVPVTRKVLPALMMRRHPPCGLIRRAGPISVVPFVFPADRIPVAVHPGIIRSGTCGTHSQHARGRRCANLNSDRNLAENAGGGEDRYGDQSFHSYSSSVELSRLGVRSCDFAH